jgi:hypothetical protein
VRLDTAGNILNDALVELGLIAAPLADPYASSDPNVVVMRAHLKALGRSLIKKYHWTHHQKPHTFDTEDGLESYALPTGYASMANQTHWNRSTSQPLAGPMGPEGWQVLKSSNAGSTISYYFRVQQNFLFLHPVPSSVQTISYEYRRAYWVAPSGQPEPTTETPTASTDTLWFDGDMLSRGLKWKFRTGKRLDASVEWNDYKEALEEAMGNDGAAPVIDLAAGARVLRPPMLPETGWGQ